MTCYDATAVTEMTLLVVDDSKLAGGYALHIAVALDDPLIIMQMGESGLKHQGSVAILERDAHGARSITPRITRYEVHLIEMKNASILFGSAITVAHIDDVVAHILLYHIPGASTQAQAFALTDGVEPVAIVFAQLTTCLNLNDGTFLLA